MFCTHETNPIDMSLTLMRKMPRTNISHMKLNVASSEKKGAQANVSDAVAVVISVF